MRKLSTLVALVSALMLGTTAFANTTAPSPSPSPQAQTTAPPSDAKPISFRLFGKTVCFGDVKDRACDLRFTPQHTAQAQPPQQHETFFGRILERARASSKATMTGGR
jgi:hypothetical protein